MNLFAYGTLMTAAGFRNALGDHAFGFRYRVARLPGWRRVWNAYREEWEGGVLNAERATEATIVGVVVEGLTLDDLSLLDAQESTHLPRQTVMVQPDGAEPVPAEIYVRSRGDFHGLPSRRYQAAVLERAAEAGAAVLDNLRTGTVDAEGRPQRLG